GVANLVRDGASAITGGGFPFTLPGVMSITSGRCCPSATSTSYYYFYNWEVSTGCEGPRVPVSATITGTATSNLAAGGTIVQNNQGLGTTVTYTDACNDLLVTVEDDPSNSTALGNTAAVVVTTGGVEVFNGTPLVPRMYDITPANNGAATVTLYVRQTEFDAYNAWLLANSSSLPQLPTSLSDMTNAANIVIAQFHGDANAANSGPLGLYDGSMVEYIASVTAVPNVSGGYWELSFPVSGFSGFFITSDNSPLSVKLKQISATNVGTRNRVDWTSASEEVGTQYVLERSADGRRFEQIAEVSGVGSGSSYTYWDEQPVYGVNYYRLRIVNIEGESSYSQIVQASVKDASVFSVSAYPNPVKDVVKVETRGVRTGKAQLILSDVTGKELRVMEVTEDVTEMVMNGMASGVYFVKYKDGAHSETIQITKH